MKKQNGVLLFSPSDLVTYLQSPFATWMNRWQLEDPDTCPEKDPQDELMSHLSQKGLEHEAQFLGVLRDQYKTLVEISDDGTDEERVAKTLDAMESGADVIFQACLIKDNFRGYADFLVKVPGASRFGEYCYEPWDTKLSKSVKPYFLIQLACYAELLEGLQATRPESMAVVLGDQSIQRFRVADYFDFYRAKKQELLAQQDAFDLQVMPDPFSYAEHGDWSNYVEQERQRRDHLSLVANITRQQVVKLESAGIRTLEQLATTTKGSVAQLNPQILETLKHQARIQLQSREAGETCFVVRKDAAVMGMGLALLPHHDRADLFWDLEGFPLEDGGLEYLWGCTYFDAHGERAFWERWAHDHASEKVAFEDFIKFAYQRWLANPGMHIYHYGHYELSVCQRLMGRYGVCENEVDELLRHKVFIDLYKVVRQGLWLGEPKYSIKNVEHLYRGSRDTDVASGGDSVAVYAAWRDLPDGDTWQSSDILRGIREYNIDDCNSTQELVDWLRQQQKAHGIAYLRATPDDTDVVAYEPSEKDRLEEALLALSEDEGHSIEDRLIAGQLAYLIKFHARANKPMWWRYFERLGKDYAELFEDVDCLAGCIKTERPPFLYKDNDRVESVEYAFDTSQEFRNRRFNSAQVIGDEKLIVSVSEVDTRSGKILLKTNKTLPESCDLIAYEHVPARTMEAAIQALVERFLEDRSLPKPLREFLLRLPPDTDQEGLLKIDELNGAEKLQQIITTVCGLRNSYISIQGPPGTGKTYTAKHIILELLRQGKSVGVTSNSHKAINHLMVTLDQLLREQGESFDLVKIEKEIDPVFSETRVRTVENNRDIEDCIAPATVVGATAWGFSRDDAHVDYLFIDEAGQVSLANLVAMSAQAKNIVCLGDQMQLPQPVEGTHPGDSGLSILDYTLQEHATIPPDMGIFLNRTYRMHKDVNALISEGIYESRLQNDPACNHQAIQFNASQSHWLKQETGIQTIQVAHEGNKQASLEEVEVIKALYQELLQASWRDKSQHEREISAHDILVVAPFNYQVNELKKALGDDARVGTVDKFQGQEAPVVIVSMAASKASESARGIDFLLNKNRINVAVSRAQALAIVIASTTLLDGAPGKIEDIERYNLFYKLLNKNA